MGCTSSKAGARDGDGPYLPEATPSNARLQTAASSARLKLNVSNKRRASSSASEMYDYTVNRLRQPSHQSPKNPDLRPFNYGFDSKVNVRKGRKPWDKDTDIKYERIETLVMSERAAEKEACGGGGRADDAKDKKLKVKGLKNFVDSHGRGGAPAWTKQFPCKSRFHPDNYIMDDRKYYEREERERLERLEASKAASYDEHQSSSNGHHGHSHSHSPCGNCSHNPYQTSDANDCSNRRAKELASPGISEFFSGLPELPVHTFAAQYQPSNRHFRDCETPATNWPMIPSMFPYQNPTPVILPSDVMFNQCNYMVPPAIGPYDYSYPGYY